jgi:hypothetical protein
MAWLRGISTGTALAVVGALLVGVLIGRLTSSSSQKDPIGPKSNENGVPVGYQHSPQGAVAAASNYLTFLDSPTVLNESRLDAGLSQIAAPGSRVAQQEKAAYSSVREELDKTGVNHAGAAVAEGKQLGYHLANYQDNHASVAIWSLDMFGNASNAQPQGGFQDELLDLRWSDGDWKLVARRSNNGPSPAIQGPPTAPNQFVTQVQQYRGFHDAP